MTDASNDDFILAVPDALPRDVCDDIVARIRASDALRPGQVGGGVYPELKHSRDVSISGQPAWKDVEQALNLTMLEALVQYLRRWPQALIAPLMLQHQPPGGGELRRLAAEDFPDMEAGQLGALARHCLRPGNINLQWYRAGEGGTLQPLPDDMVIGTVRQVLVVGIVAPMVMVGSMALHLARHPDLHAQLHQNPGRMDAAVEEFLRLYTPYRGFARTPVADTTLGGCPIRAGEALALTYASANRDEAVFDQPHQFVMERPNIAEHLAFGRGPHFCAGANLARLELRVALEELVMSTSAVQITGEVLYCPYPEIGPYRVPVGLTRRD